MMPWRWGWETVGRRMLRLPRRDWRIAVRHGGHAVFRSDGVQHSAWAAPSACGDQYSTIGLAKSDLKVMPMQSETEGQVHVQEPHSPGNVATQHRPRRGWIIGLIVFLVFAGILVSGILERIHTSAALRGETADMAVPTVSVVAPKRASPSQEITLPGNVQPFTQSPISRERTVI